MQAAKEFVAPLNEASSPEVPASTAPAPLSIVQSPPKSVRKRDGETVQDFDVEKLRRAISLAWKESKGSIDDKGIEKVVSTVLDTYRDEIVDVENVQNAVEVALMRHKQFDVAKAYILYRHERAEARKARTHKSPDGKAISDYIHASKYARYLPEKLRREVYEETVARCEGMHIQQYPHMEEEIRWAFDLVREKRVLPSMRSMQFGGRAILENHNRGYNCSYSLVDRPKVFAEALFLLLSGCGVGYSVQFDHIEKLPPLAFIDKKRVRHHVVGDTIEGWADALDALVQSFLDGTNLEISYHLIRDAGSPLRTSGGRAPGHLKLKESLEAIRCVLSKAQGRKLRSVECHRIMCHAADAVLSGGIRRSAMICLFSFDDSEMMNLKTGNWYESEPWLSNANNSVILKRDDVKKKQFKRVFNMIKQWGEPGFYFTNEHDYGTNPCFHPDTRLWTTNGYVKIGDLYRKGLPVDVIADDRPGKGDSFDADIMGVSEQSATKVFLTQKDAEVFSVTTQHGHVLCVTEQHEFPTAEGRKKLRDLRVGDTLLLPSGEGTFGTGGTADEGMILGMYVGDGTTVHDDQFAFVDVWENDFGMLDPVLKALNEIVAAVPTRHVRTYAPLQWIEGVLSEGGVQKRRAGGRRFYRWLSSIADGEDVRMLKARVPESVWTGSRDFVVGYLRGLFLTDGFVLFSGKDKKATLSLRIVQANEAILKDIQVLLGMFGVVSNVYARAEEGYRSLPDGKGGRQDYLCRATFELVINRPNATTFRDRIGLLGWKKDMADKYISIRGEDCRKPERYITKIVDIQPAGRSDVYCLTQEKTNIVTANGIVTGQCSEIGLYPKLTIGEKELKRFSDSTLAARTDLALGSMHTGWAFCNLCEINAAKLTNLDDFLEVARAAALIGTLQAGYTTMPYLGPVSELIAERDALLGIGMTGMLDAPAVACNPDFQKKVAAHIKEWNRIYAAMIGIEPAARATCVKPSGTTSLELGCVGSGHHAHHARRYIRRVIADEYEYVFQAFRAQNPHMCVRKPDGKWVIEFAVEAPKGAIVKDDIGAIEFLDMVKSTQQNWVVPGTADDDSRAPGLNHNVSNTVTVKPDEWDDVANYLWENRALFTGVSLLPSSGDKDYAFAPMEAVTTAADEARWSAIIDGYKPVDYSRLVEEDDATNLSGEVACAGGVCSIV